MEKIKKIFIILLIITIILIMIIYFLVKSQNKNGGNNEYIEDEIEDWGEEEQPEEYDNGFLAVEDNKIFFSVKNVVSKYEKICRHNLDFDYEDTNIYIGEDEYLLDIKSEKDRKQAIYELLDKQYVEKNNINIENISNFMFEIDANTILVPKSLSCKYGDNIITYIYEVYFIRGNDVKNNAFVIRVDNKNSTFSIEFVNKEFDDISQIDVDINDDYILQDDYNLFTIKNVITEQVAKEYMDSYRELILANPEIIYNYYFDEEYRDKRFGTIEEFKSYINKNIDNIRNSQVVKYSTENDEDNMIQYVCIDQYGNYYIFKEKTTMQYKVKLDTYTVLSDKFKEEYTNAEDKKKVQMNVDKFIQMINRHDYKTSYNCISEGFKNNYFDTQDKFENYIRNTFFEYNNFTFKNIEQKGNNLYTCTFEVTDYTQESNETKTVTVIMRLNDDTDFEMSFQT